jgi:hypothetical protein
MSDNPRKFEAGPDPFGRTWSVEFRWLQNGISIRHANTIDVKFFLSTPGEPAQEKVIAFNHAHLLEAAGKSGGALTDAWCLKLGAAHLRYMVESFEDMDKTLITVPAQEIQKYALRLQPAAA